MNPILLQNGYRVEYSVNPDNKYTAVHRSFSNQTNYSTNSFPVINRRAHDGLSNGALGQTLSVPANTGLDFGSHPSVTDHSYDHSNPQLLLSPPPSIEDTHSNSLLPTSSSPNFSNTGRFLKSHASSTNPFTITSAQFSEPPWGVPMMTDSRNTRTGLLPSAVSPTSLYSSTQSPLGPNFNTTNRSMDPNYGYSRPPHQWGSGEIQSPGLRYPIRPPVSVYQQPQTFSTTFSMGGWQPPMVTQSAGRPEGPPFDETKIIHTLVTGRHQPLSPDISAQIQKGFFKVDNKWTCYRRNYFAVACGFSFKTGPPDSQVYLQRHSQVELVQQYAVSISARTANVNNQESESRQLVQHTPKREKASEVVPGHHVVSPAPLHAFQSTGSLSGVPMYGGGQHTSHIIRPGLDAYGPSNQISAPTSHTFERIQFQKATANNGKRRAQQQYFHVVVELSVHTGQLGNDEGWVVVATKQSHPMVVRGRSPGHYKDNVRRDSQTDMDPDRGNGLGGDGGPINLPIPTFMGITQSSSMDWTSPQRHNQQYGAPFSRFTCESDYTPPSASSSAMTESPAESDFQFTDMVSSKGTTPYDAEGPTLSPILNTNELNTAYNRRQVSYDQKMSYEEQKVDGEHDYYNNLQRTKDVMLQRSYDYNQTAHSKPLFAS